MVSLDQNEAVTITLVVNAGILIQGGGRKLFVDGIYNGGRHPFSNPSGQMIHKMMTAQPPFHNVTDLLFTHCHADHFDCRYVEEYLKRNLVQTLLLPDRQSEGCHGLRQIAGTRAKRRIYLRTPLGQKEELRLDEHVSVGVFPVVHMGETLAHVENYCFLLRFPGKTVLILGDADDKTDYFRTMLAGEQIDALLANPLLVNRRGGRETIARAIAPKRLLIYHLPFAPDDITRFRQVSERDLERYQEELPPTVRLLEELQEVVI